ncbi:nitroreductase family protein [Haliea sp. E1-2-M8]|uniref:nitroreductase family protein n=1 Tax=Haliea sp. E1-2-M8 TaxID=3064706 RepID=UPI00271701BF|nr:nitroreductase family protein [Haliea sp. E1-2-M8]MDO8860609.1 nitroreductase family protein [Haliea sp. E1-2-M8]
MKHKDAQTQAPIDTQIRKRWSPRAFQAEAPPLDNLLTMLEAARWAPSCFNEQPWRFFLGLKGLGDTYSKIFDSLIEFNQEWAKHAPVLLLAVARTHFSANDKPNDHHAYDTGAAMSLLSLQAAEFDIYVHQMAGFDRDKAREKFAIPEGFLPLAAAAIGYRGDPQMLNERQQRTEAERRERKDWTETCFEGTWDNPLERG